MKKKKWQAYQEHGFYKGYECLGAHIRERNGKKGVEFALWAPHAKAVSLVGSFNYWNEHANPMIFEEDTGIWHCFFAGISAGESYKYKIFDHHGGSVYKADPYGYFCEKLPGTSSVVVDLSEYEWSNNHWMKQRKSKNIYQEPMNIYEIHLGSWRRNEDGSYLNYKDLVEQLIPYLKEMNYNFVELMPIMEHPFDGSWGYQTTGYFAVSSRYGTPSDMMYFIDCCHQNGIGVILDWVPGHFCRDEQGLLNFDGTPLYGKIDHPNWGTIKFDFGRPQVRNFLISNALFYFDKYRVDGIRVDGVTSILQLNFGMDQPIYRNQNGGYEDLEGIDFLKALNKAVFERYPFAVMAAEESTDWPLVTYPIDRGGLGFNFKWNMGWMNDTLKYIEHHTFERFHHHNLITFAMHYAFSENFILPLSHDEVVHGKKSLLDKIPGSYEEKFKTLKVLALYQISMPGKKLSFMGNEIAPFIEWRYYESLEWFLLEYPNHRNHQLFIKKLNAFYMKDQPLWYNEKSWDGFRWLDVNDADRSIYSYIRFSEDDETIVVFSFTNQMYNHRLGVPRPGKYRIALQTNSEDFGGEEKPLLGYITAQAIPSHGFDYSIPLDVSGLSGYLIKRKKSRK